MAHRRLAGTLLAGEGLHPGQERLLFVLCDGPRPLGELAAHLSVNAPTITKMVTRMERAGLVTSTTSTTDRRVRLAALTGDGRRAAQAAGAVWSQLDDVTGASLDEGERRTLVDLLTRCAESVEAELAAVDPACGPPC
jgi:DNA-binding MarR family transcriptional regulator